MPESKPWDKPPYWLVPCDDTFFAEADALHKQYEKIQSIMRHTRADGKLPESMHYIIPYLAAPDGSEPGVEEIKTKHCATAMLMIKGKNNLPPKLTETKKELIQALSDLNASLKDTHEHLFSDLKDTHDQANTQKRHDYLKALNDPNFYISINALKHTINHLAKMPDHSLDIYLDRQRHKNIRKLQALNAIVAKDGYPNFNAERVFIDNGLGREWVISNDCHIVPLFCGNAAIKAAGNVINMVFPHTEIAGYGFAIDFLKKDVEFANGPRVLFSSINVDPRILKILNHSKHGQGILSNLRHLAQAANHDWFHSLSYPDVNFHDPERNFNTPNAPFSQPTILDLKRAFSKIPTCGEEHNQNTYDGTTAYEKISIRSHLEVSQEIFAKTPKLKQRLLRKAADYLTDIAALKKELKERALEAPAGEKRQDALKEVDNVASYLAFIGMDRLQMVIAPNDEALNQPVTLAYGPSGKIPAVQYDSIHQLIANLELPPPTIEALKKFIVSHFLEGDNANTLAAKSLKSIPLLYQNNKADQVMGIVREYIRPKFYAHFSAIDHYFNGTDTSPKAAFQANLAMQGYATTPFWLHDLAYTEPIFDKMKPATFTGKLGYLLHEDKETAANVDQRLEGSRRDFAKSVRKKTDRHPVPPSKAGIT